MQNAFKFYVSPRNDLAGIVSSPQPLEIAAVQHNSNGTGWLFLVWHVWFEFQFRSYLPRSIGPRGFYLWGASVHVNCIVSDTLGHLMRPTRRRRRRRLTFVSISAVWHGKWADLRGRQTKRPAFCTDTLWSPLWWSDLVWNGLGNTRIQGAFVK